MRVGGGKAVVRVVLATLPYDGEREGKEKGKVWRIQRRAEG
jgi:hypothetical protein